jgi:CubicO group peptidase (beta-lactamase class C family)
MIHDFKIFIFAVMTVFGVSVTARADEVDRYVETQIRALHIPGVSVAIVRDAQIVKAKGCGLADIEASSAATSKTLYEIGSMTKQFTAAARMLLVEEGKISPDDSVTKYFADAPPRWKQITVRHLLNHISGIQNHVAVPDYLDIFETCVTSKNFPSRDELLKDLGGNSYWFSFKITNDDKIAQIYC